MLVCAVQQDGLLEKVGLVEHQYTRAGNQFVRGLSGGLKRRLSIALALAKKPQVLFLDEPTTGVDSASAAKMMTFLKTIAEQSNIAVVCTIHQPSAPVFAGFDDALILASGRVAYFGKASRVTEHFAALGKPSPPACNPAEFVLDLVNKDFTSEAGVEMLLNGWDECAPPKPAFVVSELPPPSRRASYGMQVLILLRRQLLLLVKDPSLYVARCVMNMMMVSIFALVYLEARHRIQTQAQQRCFFFVFCMAIPGQLAIGVVILSNLGLKSISREVKDGMYHPLAQWIASSIVQLPMMFALAATALWPAFWGAQLPESAFSTAVAVFAALLWTFEGIAEFFSLVRNPLNGMLYFLFFFIFAFLFCGMFVAFDDVIVVLRWICYITPLGYTMRSMLFAIFSETPDYSGAEYCTPKETLNEGTVNETVCADRGFYCPDDPFYISCFGVTGVQILDSIGVNFPVISGTNVTMGNDVLKVLAIGGVARIGFVTGLLWMSFSYKAVKPPSSSARTADYEEPSAEAPGTAKTLKSSQNGSHDVEAAANTAQVSPDHTEDASSAAGSAEAPHLDDPKTEFTFVDVAYVIPKVPFPKKPEKQILESISATVKAGDVLAIIGPSGAGKTILLNTLTLEKGPGVPSGSVTINGYKVNQRVYIQQCAYVPRDDILWPTLTARQHLDVATKLFRPKLSSKDRANAVDELLAATGMTSCQHTKAGSAFIQGLSGGQRRRLSLALALVKQPRVIVLDEPTSGLDSAAAAAIMRLLKTMAVQTGASIICTIHQPSSAVYKGFDQCLVISMGRTAYCGPADKMQAFFESIGKPAPTAANPAEFVLDEVSPEMSSKENVLAVLDAWAQKATKPDVAVNRLLDKPAASAGLCLQTWIIFQRTLSLALRDPILYVSRMVLIVILICCFGLIYLESREAVQDQVMPRLFLLNWVCTMPSILNLITVLALNNEYTNARAEMKNGMYSPVAYIIATTLVQLPMMLVLALCALVPGYAVGNWEWDGFVLMIFIYACNMWCFETMAQLFSLGSNAIFGMFNYIQIWAIALMFNGIVFRGQDVVGVLRWMYYGFPLKWFMNALCFTVFSTSNYAGIANCNYTSNMDEYNTSLFEGINLATHDVMAAGAAGTAAAAQAQVYATALATATSLGNTSLIPGLQAQVAAATATAVAQGNTASTIMGYFNEFMANPTNYTMPEPYGPTMDLVFTAVDEDGLGGSPLELDLDAYKDMMVDSLGCFRGFYCPNSSDPLQCFGATGNKILSTLNANYESISEKDDRLLDVIVMLFLAGAFKLMYIIFLFLDINTRIQVREFLNLNAPGLVIASCVIVTVVALIISGEEYGPVWL